MKSHLLIGAASSGSGKTTFTLGLLRALRNRSLKVQPFKCGPDYIDTRHHREAAGKPSVNLDSYMMSEQHITDLYHRYTNDADIAVTEGVMGLFDGYDGMKGSSAEIGYRLDIPVVLLVNAKSTAYSVAPLLYGFRHFNPAVRLVGVVFNFVASESHYSYLKQAAEDAGVEPLGYLPKQADIAIPSRHLGLTLDEGFCFDTFANRIADLVERHIDVDRLLDLTVAQREPSVPTTRDSQSLPSIGRIAVAKDAAFNFTYEENIQMLHRLGTVTYFSPLRDTRLPEADFVYLSGGYPELFLPELSKNISIHQSIHNYVEADGKLLAECGGMMYLCESIKDPQGNTYAMTGILKQSATMENMKLCLGYRELHYNGYKMRGHEFHYSSILPQENPIPSVATALTAKDAITDTPLYRYKNLLAGYTHLYWADANRNQWFLDYLTT